MTDTKNGKILYGVKGWLLFLSVWITVSRGCLFLIFAVTAAFSPELKSALVMALYAIYFAYGTSTGVLLWSKARGSVTFAKIYMLLQPVIVGMLWTIYKATPQFATDKSVGTVIGPLIGSVIWFFYLTYSKRVKNTYGLSESKKKSTVLALFLGAILGPLGSLYFGITVFLTVLISSVVSIVIMVFLGANMPTWMYIIWIPFNAIACLLLAHTYNSSVVSNEDPKASAFLVGSIIYSAWMIRIAALVTGINDTVHFIGIRRWGLAFLSLALIPVTISLATRIVLFIQALVSGLLDLIANRRHMRRL